MVHFPLQTGDHQLAVGQAGEVVVVGGPLQLLGVVLEGSDIREAGDVIMLSRLIELYPGDGQEFRVFLATLAPVPDLTPPEVLLMKGPPKGAVKFRPLAARTEHVGVVADGFFPGVTGDAGEGRVDVDNPVIGIGDDNGVLAALEHTGGDLEAAFQFLALSDVNQYRHEPAIPGGAG